MDFARDEVIGLQDRVASEWDWTGGHYCDGDGGVVEMGMRMRLR